MYHRMKPRASHNIAKIARTLSVTLLTVKELHLRNLLDFDMQLAVTCMKGYI